MASQTTALSFQSKLRSPVLPHISTTHCSSGSSDGRFAFVAPFSSESALLARTHDSSSVVSGSTPFTSAISASTLLRGSSPVARSASSPSGSRAAAFARLPASSTYGIFSPCTISGFSCFGFGLVPHLAHPFSASVATEQDSPSPRDLAGKTGTRFPDRPLANHSSTDGVDAISSSPPLAHIQSTGDLDRSSYPELPQSLGFGYSDARTTIQELPGSSSLMAYHSADLGGKFLEHGESSSRGNLALANFTGASSSSFLLPESLGICNIEVAPTSVMPSPSHETTRTLLAESEKDPIHVVDPARERKGKQVAVARPSRVRPKIPPGFGPLPADQLGPRVAPITGPVEQGPLTITANPGPVQQGQAWAPTYGPVFAPLAGPSQPNPVTETMLESILKSQRETSRKIISIHESNLDLGNRIVQISQDTDKGIETVERDLAKSGNLVAKIDALEARGVEKERTFLGWAAKDKSSTNELKCELEKLKDELKNSNEIAAEEKRGNKIGKWTIFGGITIGVVGIGYLYFRK